MFRPEDHFTYDSRLGIPLPSLQREWELYSDSERAAILLYWETVRGAIPDRIKGFEANIIGSQSRLDQEDNFVESCRLNWEIAEFASRINDLQIWFRLNQEAGVDRTHS